MFPPYVYYQYRIEKYPLHSWSVSLDNCTPSRCPGNDTQGYQLLGNRRILGGKQHIFRDIIHGDVKDLVQDQKLKFS